jgi:glycosyltransferase involved in cell wall biosynthesis
MIDQFQRGTIPNVRVPLSIAVPTYNRAHFMTTLIRSILDQADNADEIIVSDDGSADDTIGRVLSLDRQIRIFQSTTNRGMVANWNRCLELATREWICILHDDDRLEPGGLTALRTACSLVDEPALILHQYSGDQFAGAFRCTISRACPWNVLNCPTIPSGAVVHRSILDTMGVFDPRLKYSADLEFFPRIAARFPLVVIESPRVVNFRLHGDNYELKTWRNPDFYGQLEEIQRTIFRHAGIGEEDQLRNLLANRMEGNLRHMLDLAASFGDASLVRFIAGQYLKCCFRLSFKRRTMLHIAALTGIRLGRRRDFRNAP